MRRLAIAGLMILICAWAQAQVPASLTVADFEDNAQPWTAGTGDRGGVGTPEITAEVAHSGSQSLAFNYDFTGTAGTAYIYARVFANLSLPGTPQSLSFWIKGDGSGRSFCLRMMDGAEEFWQRGLGVLDFTDWKQISFPVAAEGVHHFGGPEATSGKLDLPLTLVEFIIDKSKDEEPKGAVYIDDIVLETRLDRRDLVSVKVSVDAPDDAVGDGPVDVSGVVTLKSLSKAKRKGELAWRLIDYKDRRIATGRQKITLEAGDRQAVPLNVSVPGPGYYELAAVLEAGDSHYRGSAEFSVVAPSPLKQVDPESSIGINGHLANPREMAMMQKAGIKWMRADWLWGVCQPKPGEFNWEVLDSRYESAREHGIKLLPILCYGSSWATTKPEGADGGADRYMPQLEPWLTYVRAVVGRYKGDITHWEVWNEPNIGFWLSSNEDYVRLLKETYKAIKQVDPTATVLMGGTAGAPTDYIRMLYEAGCKDYMDIINIHPYQYPRMPDAGMADAVRSVRDTMRQYDDADKPIWVTEVGYPNHIGSSGVDLRTQADYLARTYIELLSAGVEKIFWYDYQNGTDRTYNEHNFGIVFVGDKPKPCYFSVQRLSEMLGDAEFAGSPDTPDGIAARQFRKPDGTEVFCLWALDGEATVRVDARGPMTVTDLMGARTTLSAFASITLSVAGSPLFISSSRPPAIELAGQMTVSPERTETFPTTATRLKVSLRNSSRGALDGLLSVRMPDGWTLAKHERRYLLAAGEEREIELECAANPTTEYGEHAIKVHFNGLKGRDSVRMVRTVAVELKAPWKVEFLPRREDGKPVIEAQVTNLLGRPLRANPWWAAPLCPAVTGDKPWRNRTVFLPGKPVSVRANDRYATDATEPPYLPTVLRLDGTDVPIATYTTRFACAEASRVNGKRLHRNLEPRDPGTYELRHEGQVQQMRDWGGPADLSAVLQPLWDDTNLVLRVRVWDDAFSQKHSGGNVWQGDSVQFAIDPDYAHTPGAAYAEYDVALTPGGPEIFRRQALGESEKTGSSVEIDRNGGGVFYDISVPWSELGIEPRAGKRLGLSLLVNDDDGAGRRGWIEWGGGIGWTKDPMQYMDITLAN